MILFQQTVHLPLTWINITGKLPQYSSFSLPGPLVFLKDTLEKSSRPASAAKATGSRVWRRPENTTDGKKLLH